MPVQSLPRNILIKLIKTGQRALGLDDETYRDMLESATGLRSCADKRMTPQKLTAVLARMRELGFVPAPRTQGKPQTQGRAVRKAKLGSGKQLGRIRGLWQRMYSFGIVRDASDTALDSYCRRMVGADMERCTAAQCQRLIECLKQWWTRAANPEHTAILENMLGEAYEGTPHVVQ